MNYNLLFYEVVYKKYFLLLMSTPKEEHKDAYILSIEKVLNKAQHYLEGRGHAMDLINLITEEVLRKSSSGQIDMINCLHKANIIVNYTVIFLETNSKDVLDLLVQDYSDQLEVKMIQDCLDEQYEYLLYAEKSTLLKQLQKINQDKPIIKPYKQKKHKATDNSNSKKKQKV